MPDEEKQIISVRHAGDWPGFALVVCVFLLIVLCVGEPDLLDAIITRVMVK